MDDIQYSFRNPTAQIQSTPAGHQGELGEEATDLAAGIDQQKIGVQSCWKMTPLRPHAKQVRLLKIKKEATP